MSASKPVRFRFLTALITLASVTACTDQDIPTANYFPEDAILSEASHVPAGEALKVMTRNMYLGGDVGLVFAANPNDLPAVVAAATSVWNQIQQNNFPERALALAREISANRPHVVGIQEIPQYVVFDQTQSVVQAQDHLALLMAALEGSPYSVAAVQENTVAFLPILLGTEIHYVRYTDRIAVLVRDDLNVTGTAQGNYSVGYQLNPNLNLLRGWIRVSASVGNVPYHFVNTHLEVQSFAPIQALQTQELIEGVTAGLEGVTILMGDLNSDAEGGPGISSWTPTYGTLLAAGFQDSWEIANPGQRKIGYTCCQGPLLRDSSLELDERIDFILLRSSERKGGEDRIPGSIHVERIGDEIQDLTSPSGLWPSDHAGLMASMKVPTVIFRSR